MYIKDLTTGEVREYGTDCHDSLRISEDGNYLFYEHLQNGGGSGPFGDYRFVTDREGRIPAEYEVLLKQFADAYFNIGGFYNKKALKEQMSQHDKEIFMEGWKAGYRACEDLNKEVEDADTN